MYFFNSTSQSAAEIAVQILKMYKSMQVTVLSNKSNNSFNWINSVVTAYTKHLWLISIRLMKTRFFKFFLKFQEN